MSIDDGTIYHLEEITEGNPTPDGQSTGLAPDLDDIKNELKKIGGDLTQEVDPLKNPLGRSLVESGKIPGGEIDPSDLAGIIMEDPLVGGGQGGLDPRLPIGGQITNQKAKRSFEDVIDKNNPISQLTGVTSDRTFDLNDLKLSGDAPQDFGGADANPELVNPQPVWKGRELLLILELLDTLP